METEAVNDILKIVIKVKKKNKFVSVEFLTFLPLEAWILAV